MKKQIKYLTALILFLGITSSVIQAQVLDDITERNIVSERRLLAHTPIREADIFWKKRVWRVIDTREKMNLPFVYPQAPFFDILKEAVQSGALQAYTTEDDQFTYKMETTENVFGTIDTIPIYDPDTGEITYEVVTNDFGYEDIKRFRIKEVWYFDEQTSRMRVRILGLAPLRDITDDNGNFRYEKPMFWVYYPEFRNILHRHEAFNAGNDASSISWADVMEQRYFASYIYKQSNVLDARLSDIYTGVDRLLEGEKIKQEIFNFEHDLWEY